MTDAGGSASVDAVTDALITTENATAQYWQDAAGVTICELSTADELHALHQLFQEIWNPHDGAPLVSAEILRALGKAGNYVVGAFERDELVAGCVGFFNPPARAGLHSHIAGVSARARGRNIGFALKVHQRAWALPRGIATVEWTFDPLVRRNAHFNIAKLAGRPVEYLTNFYGPMSDSINGDDDTDRLLVRWDLLAPEVAAACRPGDHGVDAVDLSTAEVALARSTAAEPVFGPVDGPVVLVDIPDDVEALRAVRPDTVTAWRSAVRKVLGDLLGSGYRIVGFDRVRGYVLTATR